MDGDGGSESKAQPQWPRQLLQQLLQASPSQTWLAAEMPGCHGAAHAAVGVAVVAAAAVGFAVHGGGAGAAGLSIELKQCARAQCWHWGSCHWLWASSCCESSLDW